MCGLVGFIKLKYSTESCLQVNASRMANRLYHRGPDDAGIWVDSDVNLALGFRRLSIIDLSSSGHQPMHSICGRYVIVFNGEIYNHLEIRHDLGGNVASMNELRRHSWRGHSDTETLLAAIVAWGLEVTLKRCVGMFAIALWDRLTQTLTLARDRFGEKPLYYGWLGSGDERAFVFASELKSLKTYSDFDAPVCREALSQYMRFMYVPAPLSIYEGIYKLLPGCMLTVLGQPPSAAPGQPLQPDQIHGSLTLKRWWSFAHAVEAGCKNQFTNDHDAIISLESHLHESVRIQSLADVPLGAFLSGGIDSSIIVALMQHQSSREGRDPVKTFTIGFEDAAFDESPYASAVARHLGTDHAKILVTAANAQGVITQLPEIYDEPFADSSQIPTYLVCKAAKQHVTVALSGDAGDELFGGYNRYFWGPRIWNRISWLPYSLRKVLGSAITSFPISAWDRLSTPLNSLLSNSNSISQVGYRAHKFAIKLQNVRSKDDLYLSLISEWQDPAEVVKGYKSSWGPGGGVLIDIPQNLSDVEQMMYGDATNYLPNDILCKVDRAAMATSLETRMPFLDHRLAELAWRLPLHMKVRGNTGKWVLRQVLYKYVPAQLIERPKAGFSIPIGQWMRGPLRDWVEALLNENQLQEQGFLNPIPIRRRWEEHLSGQTDHTASLWAILMFQSWLLAQEMSS
jgi:asparagine synthase (glutamine-hydrolysing)